MLLILDQIILQNVPDFTVCSKQKLTLKFDCVIEINWHVLLQQRPGADLCMLPFMLQCTRTCISEHAIKQQYFIFIWKHVEFKTGRYDAWLWKPLAGRAVSSDPELVEMSWIKDSQRTGVGGDRYISIERLLRETWSRPHPTSFTLT